MTFSWEPPEPHSYTDLFAELKPHEVLYFFDTPLLYVSRPRPFPVICYKLDEVGGKSQYLISQTNDRVVSQVRNGSLSVNSALSQPWLWIAEADKQFNVTRCVGLSSESIPADILPEQGYGLASEHGIIPERQTSGTPFLSIHFRGGETYADKTLPLAVLKATINELYNSLWKIFAPAIHAAAPAVSENIMRRALTIPVLEPVFASLSVAVERPRLDFARIRDKPELDIAQAEQNIANAHDAFLESADAIAAAARQGQLTEGIASDHLEAIEAVAQLVPNERSFFDEVRIEGINLNTRVEKSLTIDFESGSRIRDAYQLTTISHRSITGIIVIVNQRSHSFVIRLPSYKEVTCHAYTDPIRHAIGLLRNGMEATVSGPYTRRPQRDQLNIQRLIFDGHDIAA